MKIFYKILNFENLYFSPPHYKLCETEVSVNTSKYVLYMQGYTLRKRPPGVFFGKIVILIKSVCRRHKRVCYDLSH